MKIHFLIFDIYGMGGTVRTVLNVANFLAEKGYDIEIISVFKRRAVPFFEIHPDIKIKVLHNTLTKRKKTGVKGRLVNKLSRTKSRYIHPDDEAYHLFSLLSDIKMLSYLKELRSGILVTTRTSFNIFAAQHLQNQDLVIIGQEHLNYTIYSDRLKKDIIKKYKGLNYLATLTDDDTKDYQQLLDGLGIEVVKLTNSIPKMEQTKAPLDAKTIMAAGRLVPQKGFDLLIEAFAKVHPHYPEWKLKIFGFGRDHAMLQQLINDYKLYNHVLLMGPSQDIEGELARSSIYALSSRFEGFGMVIVEAMQCGVPVVSFDCPRGPSEIITHNVDGLLIEDGNVDAFADGLMELMGNKEKRKAFGEKAIDNVTRYEIENIGQLWIDLIEEIKQKKQK